MEHFEDIGPSVVLASPGMMQSGLSRELFESWCTDKRNGCIIAGYCVEGTLAKVQSQNEVLNKFKKCVDFSQNMKCFVIQFDVHVCYYGFKLTFKTFSPCVTLQFPSFLSIYMKYINFYAPSAPVLKDRGHIVFGLSVCLSAKTLTLAIYFEWEVIGLSYFICVFLMTRPFYWYHNF
jgi:hypothetical protein